MKAKKIKLDLKDVPVQKTWGMLGDNTLSSLYFTHRCATDTYRSGDKAVRCILMTEEKYNHIIRNQNMKKQINELKQYIIELQEVITQLRTKS